ncbi:MAG: hypothetical protein ACRDLB_13350 [Actinomycetota bacterium]
MRKLLGLVVATALLTAHPAAGGNGRVEEQSYARPMGIWTSHFDEGMRSLPEDALIFHPKRGERRVHLDFDDALGQKVLVHITQGESSHEAEDPTGVHPYSDGHITCAYEYDFKLTSTDPIEVRVYSGLCPNHTFGYASTGTVTATFAKKR